MDPAPVMNWWNSPPLYLVLVGLGGIALLKAMQTVFHAAPFRRVLSAGRQGAQEGMKP